MARDGIVNGEESLKWRESQEFVTLLSGLPPEVQERSAR
jgi:hypothetical protein